MDDIRDPSTPILIVDDNLQYTKILSRMLAGGFGYTNIESADTTESAFELIVARPDHFKLLFVDYNFPEGESGGAFLERLQAKHLLQGAAAFLITADPTIENVAEARAAGAVGVVAKPFDRVAIAQQLELAMRLFRLRNADSF